MISTTKITLSSEHNSSTCMHILYCKSPHHTTNVLQPFFLLWRVSEENFWTLWCNGRLTEADTPTIRMGATPSGLSSAHLHHRPCFYSPDALLSPNQQCQSTEGILYITVQYSILYILYRTQGIYCAINCAINFMTGPFLLSISVLCLF